MLWKYFEAPGRIRAIRSGPYGALIEGFANQLFQRGYAQVSARRHIRAAEHFVRWAVHRGLSDHDLNVQVLERFADHLSRCRCGRYCCANYLDVVAGATLFLRHVQGVDEPPVRSQQPVQAEPDLLKSFCAWCGNNAEHLTKRSTTTAYRFVNDQTHWRGSE